MRQLFLSLIVTAFAFTSMAAPKHTASLNGCDASFDNLIAVTSSVTSLTAKEQGGLTKIATDAKNLYFIGKTSDALKKLGDYQ